MTTSVPCQRQTINALHSCYSSLCLVPRNRRSKHGPQFAHLWAQCYSLNNWISHWCKVSSFHWTTLMQGILDITGAGCEYDFT